MVKLLENIGLVNEVLRDQLGLDAQGAAAPPWVWVAKKLA